MPGAGSENPEPAVEPARRMRHRQLLGDDGVAGDVDDAAALGAPVTPSVDDIASARCRDKGGSAVPHRKAIGVAAVLGGELGNERRLPEGTEAMGGGERC